VFDRTPEVNRAERKATKFVSAEEEANIRKNELAALKAQKDSASSSSAVAAPVPETENSGPVALTAEILEAVTQIDENGAEKSVGGDDGENPGELSRRPSVRRRSSILESSNPDMIKALTRMMSSSTLPDNPSPQALPITRRGSINRSASISDASGTAGAGEEKVEVKEVKVTKSKLLMVSDLIIYPTTVLTLLLMTNLETFWWRKCRRSFSKSISCSWRTSCDAILPRPIEGSFTREEPISRCSWSRGCW
jgi:hypothetical protein